MNVGLLPIVLGIDVRRPASWLGLAAGAIAGGCLVGGDRDAWSASLAFLLPTLAVVAAIGDPPLDICRGSSRCPPVGLAVLWILERAAWPLAGGVITAFVTVWFAASSAVSCLVAVVGTLLATIAVGVVRQSGLPAADAAAVAVALSGAGAAALLAARAGAWGGWGTLGASGVGWLLAAALTRAWLRPAAAERPAVASMEPAAAGREAGPADSLPATGLVQDRLQKAAMVTAVLAMAGWLASHADQDGARVTASSVWAALSATWFVALAVPRGLLGDGVCGDAAWERLFRATRSPARRGRGGFRMAAGLPLGENRFTVAAALTPAAILGWPPLVGGVISLTRPQQAWPPLAIAGGLVLAAAALAGLAILGRIVGASRETLFAAGMAVVVALAGGLHLVVSSSVPPRPQAASPGSPRPPSLVGEAATSPSGPHFPRSDRIG